MLLVVVLSLVMAATALPASGTNPEEARVAQTREELEAVRAELEEARDEADSDQVALEEADRQLQAAFDAVQAANQAVDRQEAAVRDAEDRLVDAQVDLQEQRELMGDRVGRLYRHAGPDPLIQMLGASTVTDAVQQSAYMSAIGREDRAAVESLANAETTVAAEEAALEAEQVSLGRVVEEQQLVLAEVEEMREDTALVAAASEDMVVQLQARENHLEEESAQLTALIEQQAAEAAAAEAAAAQAAAAQAAARTQPNAPAPTAGNEGTARAADEQPADQGGAEESADEDETPAAPVPVAAPPSGGGFSWPGGGGITSPFGTRGGRLHAGIDIGGSPGASIVAARGGTVTTAGTMNGYGNVVMIAHGGGFTTVYAHLQSIAVSSGQSVSAGTYLGGMGCTGSCTGTHLHFEIRANGTPVDPMAYL